MHKQFFRRITWALIAAGVAIGAYIAVAMMRVVSSSDLVAAPAFSNAYEKCRHLCLSFCENYIPHQKESTREAEQANSRQPCGFMTNQGMLKILWDEGLW